MLKTRESGTWMLSAVLALPLALGGIACGEGSGEVAQNSASARKKSVTPVAEKKTTYGIDEVMPASVTSTVPAMEVLPQVVPDQSEPAFLLPDLALRAGDGRDHMEEGTGLYRQGRFLEAAAHLQVALEEKPEGWYEAYMLGLCLWKAGDLDGADTALQQAAEGRPEFVRTHVNRSRVLNEAGRFAEALEAASQAVSLAGDDASAHFLRGRSLANLGRTAEAAAALQESLDIDAENGDVWNRLGLLHLRQARFEEAVVALEQAVALRPGPAYVHNNLGLAYEGAGRLDEAAASFAAGMEATGDTSRLAVNLGRVREVLGLPPFPGLSTPPETELAASRQ